MFRALLGLPATGSHNLSSELPWMKRLDQKNDAVRIPSARKLGMDLALWPNQSEVYSRVISRVMKGKGERERDPETVSRLS